MVKKQYSKPTLVIEDFRMDVSIASACETSSVEIEGMLAALQQANPGATIQELIELLNQQGIGEYCYHTSQGTNVFNS